MFGGDWRLTDALISVVERDAFVDVAPVGFPEVGLDTRAGDDVDAVLAVVERLEYSHERGSGVAITVEAGAVVVELDDALLVRLHHFLHNVAEPAEGALIPGRPVEVGAPRAERR